MLAEAQPNLGSSPNAQSCCKFRCKFRTRINPFILLVGFPVATAQGIVQELGLSRMRSSSDHQLRETSSHTHLPIHNL